MEQRKVVEQKLFDSLCTTTVYPLLKLVLLARLNHPLSQLIVKPQNLWESWPIDDKWPEGLMQCDVVCFLSRICGTQIILNYRSVHKVKTCAMLWIHWFIAFCSKEEKQDPFWGRTYRWLWIRHFLSREIQWPSSFFLVQYTIMTCQFNHHSGKAKCW